MRVNFNNQMSFGATLYNNEALYKVKEYAKEIGMKNALEQVEKVIEKYPEGNIMLNAVKYPTSAMGYNPKSASKLTFVDPNSVTVPHSMRQSYTNTNPFAVAFNHIMELKDKTSDVYRALFNSNKA